MFAKPNRQSEPEPRRRAVRINVATDTRDSVTEWIADGIDKQDERGKQRLIGPSEIGTPCDFCLGAKLAGLEQRREFDWSPYGGTQVHKGLSKIFKPHASQWFADYRVTVGEIDGQEISGELDLFDVERNTVVDFKYPMDRTLDKVRFSGAVSPNYDVQADLYGVGLKREGWKVTNVAIFFLPRCTHITKPEQLWSRGFWYARKLDEKRAQAALARADRIARHIRLAGADVVLPTLERSPDCFDCKQNRWIYQENN